MKNQQHFNQSLLFLAVAVGLTLMTACPALAANRVSAPRLVSQETTRMTAEALCRSKYGRLPLLAQESYLDSDGERSCDVYVFAKDERWLGHQQDLLDTVRFHRAQLAAYVDSIRFVDQFETETSPQSELLSRYRQMTDFHVKMSTRPDEFVSVYTSASRNHKPVMEYRDGLPESFVMPHDLDQQFSASSLGTAKPLDFYYFGPARIFAAERTSGPRLFVNLTNPDFTLTEDQVAGTRFNLSGLDEEFLHSTEESWDRIEAMTTQGLEDVVMVDKQLSHIIPNVPYFRQDDWTNILPKRDSCVVMAGGSALGYYDDFDFWNISPFSYHVGGTANGGFTTLPGVNYTVTIPGASYNPRKVHYGPETMLFEMAVEIGYNFQTGGTGTSCTASGFTLAEIFTRFTDDHLGLDFTYDQDCLIPYGAFYGTIKERMDANQPMILKLTNYPGSNYSVPYPYQGHHAVTIVGYDEAHGVGGDPIGVYVNNSTTYGAVWWDYDQIRSDNDEITLEITAGGSPGAWVEAPTLIEPVGTVGAGPVHFAWAEAPGAASYLVQVSQFSNFESYPYFTVSTNPAADFNIPDEGPYYWRVAPANENGVYCRFGEVQSFTVGGCCSTWHVETSGSDQTGDGTESNPFATIQRAIDASGHFDTVLVGPGVYVENITINKQILVTSHMIEPWEEGYIGETIIDGGRSGSTVSIVGSTATLSELRGFTIRNGLATSGGGIAVGRANPTLRKLKVVDNEATSNGGGIYLYQSTSLIENVTVSSNIAVMNVCGSVGGGIDFREASPTLRNSVISWNQAALFGGGLSLRYGSDPILETVTITNNSVISTVCSSSGAGIEVSGSSVTMTDVTIMDNLAIPLPNAGSGAGVGASDAVVTFTDGIVSGNQSSAGGAGISVRNTTLDLTRVQIHGNRSTGTMLGGGALFLNTGSNANLINVTIADNEASMGSGIHCQDNSALVMVNSILWNGGSPQTVYCSDYAAPSTLTIANSSVEGGQAGILLNGNASLNWLGGNQNQDPLYSDPTHENFGLRTLSPCIDTGTTYFEWGGQTLVDLSPGDYSGAGPDMGAHEATYIAAVVDPTGSGDFASLSDAVNNVPSGTVLLLADGIYSGPGNRDIDLGGKIITFKSASKSAERCVIDCQGSSADPHRGFYFHSGESPLTRIEDITIINGFATTSLPGGGHGGGILCENGSSPTLVNVTFSNNTAQGRGGALHCVASYPTLEACTISGNQADEGAGISCTDSSAPEIQRTIIAFNGPGEAVNCASDSIPVISCSDIFGNTGGDWVGPIASLEGVDGNISQDPLFCSAEPNVEMRWLLQNNSPCLTVYSPGVCHIGAWPIGCSSASETTPPLVITALGSPFPNPFNPTAIIPFSIDRPQQVRLSIYDLTGNLVAVLLDQAVSQGEHRQAWNGLNRAGQPVSSGVYFVQFQGASTSFTRKLALLR